MLTIIITKNYVFRTLAGIILPTWYHMILSI